MHIIFGNYGNGTIALTQWAFEQKLADVYVINVDTGWAAQEWFPRVRQGREFVERCQFTPITLISPPLAKLVQERNSFPTKKFQWCPSFLKGLPLLDWLDEKDPACEATVLFSKRRCASRANQDLPGHIEESIHQGDRPVWHPLYQHDDIAYRALIERSGFSFLPHRSLECDPCIHSTVMDFQRMSQSTVDRCDMLESQLGQTMFEESVKIMTQESLANYSDDSQTYEEQFDMGCGSFFGCGE